MKFRGEPNEQVVTGSFGGVTGTLRLVKSEGKFKASGLFLIDLESFNSGIALGDYNIRTVVLNAPRDHFAEFRLTGVRVAGGSLAVALGREFTAECVGALTLNGVTRVLRFGARATLLPEKLLEAQVEEEIVMNAQQRPMRHTGQPPVLNG